MFQIPTVDKEILQDAFSHLQDAIGNINCLYSFITKKYPMYKEIEYTLYIHSIYRAKEIESIMETPIAYPVFGKEIDMGDRNIIYSIVKTNLGVNKIGILESFDDDNCICVNKSLDLYEKEI